MQLWLKIVIAIVVVIVIAIIAYLAYYFATSSDAAAAAADAAAKLEAEKAAAKAKAEMEAEASAKAAEEAAAKAAADAAAAAAAASEAAIAKALAETYGFQSSYPESAMCGSEQCAYGNVFDIKKGQCGAWGGRWNGSPADDQIIGCHLNIGHKPSWGFAAPGICSAQQAKAYMTGRACRAIGGTEEPAGLADNTWGRCTVSVCPPKTATHMLAKINAANTYGQARFYTPDATQCNRVGGSYSGGSWGLCSMDVVPTPDALKQ